MNNLILSASNSWTTETLVFCVLSLLVVIVSEAFLIYFLLNKFGKSLSKNSSETQEFSAAENLQSFPSNDKNADVEEDFNKPVSDLKSEPFNNEDKAVLGKNSNKLSDDFSVTENKKNDKGTCPFLPEDEVEKIFDSVFGLNDIDVDNVSFNSDAADLNASAETCPKIATETPSEIVAPETAVSETDDNIFSAADFPDVASSDNDYVCDENFEPEIVEQKIVAPETAVADGLRKSFAAPFIDNAPNVRYLRSFTAKLCQSNDLLKERYSSLKNELLSYGKVKSRTSWFFETFRAGNNPLAKFAINGKTLSLYLALSPQALSGTKYHFKDVSQYKKYAAVPLRMKIKSNRSVRWTKELIAIMASEYNLVKLNRDEVDYYPEYRDLEELIAMKEVKVEYKGKTIFNDVGESAEYVAADEVATAVENACENDCENDCVNTNYVVPKATVGFYGGVSHVGEKPMAVIDEVDIDVVSDREAKTDLPFNLEADAVVEAIENIENGELVKNNETVSSNTETSEKRDEVVPLTDRDFEAVKEVTVVKAENAMADDRAESLVEKQTKTADFYEGTAQGIINVDTLSKNYLAGETVNLESLKAKKLLPKKVGYVKVLARGIIDKPLCVEADEFSLSAVKMILLTGGRAVRTSRKKQ